MFTDGNFLDKIRELQQQQDISRELVVKLVTDSLRAAYKKHFGTDENAIIHVKEDYSAIGLFAKKEIVDDTMVDPVFEISLKDALELNSNCEVGDVLEVEIDPKKFGRNDIHTAKQRARQDIIESKKNSIYTAYKDKVGELLIGYFQRESRGSIYVDLGKAEGVLPRKFQSSREIYRPGDRIKGLVVEVNDERASHVQIVLSRTHTDLVRKVFEMEVPEIYDGTVEIFKIVREAGYRTKLAVYSRRDDVDSIGACVGVKGIRIQTIVRELEGERVDILRYDPDPIIFIKNSLSPAEVEQVYILDAEKKQALAIVAEDQLSFAIGKQGLNIRLANRLTDWNIDIKTQEQASEMDISNLRSSGVSNLFDEDDEIVSIKELPGVTERLVEVLAQNGINQIDELIALDDEELAKLHSVNEDDIKLLKSIISENIEIVDSDYEEDEDVYLCPECEAEISVDMLECPNCGVGLDFQEEVGE